MTPTFIAVSVVLIRERIQQKDHVWGINSNNEQGTLQFTNEIYRYDFISALNNRMRASPISEGSPEQRGQVTCSSSYK